MTRPGPRIRYGMVGGGPGAFIGGVHRMAAALDGEWLLTAGAFSSVPEKSAALGEQLGLEPARAYGSFEAMMRAEAALPPDERIEVVTIVTPNHLHHPVALAALDAGFHVVCDKPLTRTVAEAEQLHRRAAETGRLFCVTYNYSGYPMVKEAQERVAGGALGRLRKVVVEYSQGWLATLLEAEGNRQAAWRADPERAGISSALGDIGSHAHHLAEYVTGRRMVEVFGDLGTVVPGRLLDDDATVLFRMDGGVRGVLLASQVSYGERNHLRLRIYGDEGGLDWSQEEPDRLRLTHHDGTETVVHRGGHLSARAAAATRLPGGHPEGFIEAFANVYRAVAQSLRAPAAEGDEPLARDFPTVEDGVRGVRFLHAAVESSRRRTWMEV